MGIITCFVLEEKKKNFKSAQIIATFKPRIY